MSKGATQPSEDLPTSGVLTSPNFPNRYTDSLQLTQTIRVPKGNIIVIQFTGKTILIGRPYTVQFLLNFRF